MAGAVQLTVMRLLQEVNPELDHDVDVRARCTAAGHARAGRPTSALSQRAREALEELAGEGEAQLHWLMECLITAMGNDDLPHIRREAAIMLLDPFILELQEAGHLVEPCLQSFMSCLESPVPSLRTCGAQGFLDLHDALDQLPEYQAVLEDLCSCIVQASVEWVKSDYGTAPGKEDFELTSKQTGALLLLNFMVDEGLPLIERPWLLPAVLQLCVLSPQEAACFPHRSSDIISTSQATDQARALVTRYGAALPGVQLHVGAEPASTAAGVTTVGSSWLRAPAAVADSVIFTTGQLQGEGQVKFTRTPRVLATLLLGHAFSLALAGERDWRDTILRTFAQVVVGQWLFGEGTDAVSVRKREAALSLLSFIGRETETAIDEGEEPPESVLLIPLSLPRILRLTFPAYEPSFMVRSAAVLALQGLIPALNGLLRQADGLPATPQNKEVELVKCKFHAGLDLEGAVLRPPSQLDTQQCVLPGPWASSATPDLLLLLGGEDRARGWVSGLPPMPAWMKGSPVDPTTLVVDFLSGMMRSGAEEAAALTDTLATEGGSAAPPPPPPTAQPDAMQEAVPGSPEAHSPGGWDTLEGCGMDEGDDAFDEDVPGGDEDAPPAEEDAPVAAAPPPPGGAAAGPASCSSDPYGSPAARGLVQGALPQSLPDLRVFAWDAYNSKYALPPGPELAAVLGLDTSDSAMVRHGADPNGALAFVLEKDAQAALNLPDSEKWSVDIDPASEPYDGSFEQQMLCALLVNNQPDCPQYWAQSMMEADAGTFRMLFRVPYRLRVAAVAATLNVALPGLVSALGAVAKHRRMSQGAIVSAWLGWHAAKGSGGFTAASSLPSLPVLGDGVEDDAWAVEADPSASSAALAAAWMAKATLRAAGAERMLTTSSSEHALLARLVGAQTMQGRWLNGSVWSAVGTIRSAHRHTVYGDVVQNVMASVGLEPTLYSIPSVSRGVLDALLPLWHRMLAPLEAASAFTPDALSVVGRLFGPMPGAPGVQGKAAEALLGHFASAGDGTMPVGSPPPTPLALRHVMSCISNTVQSMAEVPAPLDAQILSLAITTCEWALLCLLSNPLAGSASARATQRNPWEGFTLLPSSALATMTDQEREAYNADLQCAKDKAALRGYATACSWLLPRTLALYVACSTLDMLSYLIDTWGSSLGDHLTDPITTWRLFRVLALGVNTYEQQGASAVLHRCVAPVASALLTAGGVTPLAGSGTAQPAAGGSGAAAGHATAGLRGKLDACPDLSTAVGQVAALVQNARGVGVSLMPAPMTPADYNADLGYGASLSEEETRIGSAEEEESDLKDSSGLQEMQEAMESATAAWADSLPFAPDMDDQEVMEVGEASASSGWFALGHGSLHSGSLAVLGNMLRHAPQCFSPSALHEAACKHLDNTLDSIARALVPSIAQDAPVPPLAMRFVARTVRRAQALVTGESSWLNSNAGSTGVAEHMLLPCASDTLPPCPLALLMAIGHIPPHCLQPDSTDLPLAWPAEDPTGASGGENAPATPRLPCCPPGTHLDLVTALARDIASTAARSSIAFSRRALDIGEAGEVPLHVNSMWAAAMAVRSLGKQLAGSVVPADWAAAMPPPGTPGFYTEERGDGTESFRVFSLPAALVHALRMGDPRSPGATALAQGHHPALRVMPYIWSPDHDHMVMDGSTSSDAPVEFSEDDLQQVLLGPPGMQAVEESHGQLAAQGLAMVLMEAMHHSGGSVPSAEEASQMVQHWMLAHALPEHSTGTPPAEVWLRTLIVCQLPSALENTVQGVAALLQSTLEPKAAPSAPVRALVHSIWLPWCAAVRCAPFVDAMDERHAALSALLHAACLVPEVCLPEELGFTSAPSSSASAEAAHAGVSVQIARLQALLSALARAQLKALPAAPWLSGSRRRARVPAENVASIAKLARRALGSVRAAIFKCVDDMVAEGRVPEPLVGKARDAVWAAIMEAIPPRLLKVAAALIL